MRLTATALSMIVLLVACEAAVRFVAISSNDVGSHPVCASRSRVATAGA
jgi:hypothetical protein